MLELNKNENTILLPNIASVVENVAINRYSFEHNELLHDALAARFNQPGACGCTGDFAMRKLDASNFILGAGSSDVIFMFFQAIAKLASNARVQVLAQWPSFEVVLDYARALGFSVRYESPLIAGAPEGDALDDEAIKIYYECSPNNPTGLVCSRERLEFLKARALAGDWVVLDEAYAEFNPEHEGVAMASEHFLHVRTFSKAFGLAGARIGYGCADAALIAKMSEFYNPDRINAFALALALAALKDEDFLPCLQAELAAQKARVLGFLDACGVEYFKSAGNFVLHKVRAGDYADFMAARGIAVGAILHCGGEIYNRVSIGGEADTTALLAAMSAARKAGKI